MKTHSKNHRGQAFTLIELLVVIGIIVLLAGLLLPMLNKVWKNARKTRTAADLQAISMGLEAYKTDFYDYPRVEYNPANAGANATHPNVPQLSGAQILCRALIGPAPAVDLNPVANADLIQDGQDGPGFKLRAQGGRKYGPYLDANRFKTGNPQNPSTSNPAEILLWSILDGNGNPILYFPAAKKVANPNANFIGQTAAANGWLQTFVWDLTDNLRITDQTGILIFTRPGDGGANWQTRRMAMLLGDYDPSNPTAATNYNNAIDGKERANTTGPYILWDAGEDGKFGVDGDPSAATSSMIQKCDDVANFSFVQ